MKTSGWAFYKDKKFLKSAEEKKRQANNLARHGILVIVTIAGDSIEQNQDSTPALARFFCVEISAVVSEVHVRV